MKSSDFQKKVVVLIINQNYTHGLVKEFITSKPFIVKRRPFPYFSVRCEN